MTMTTKQQWNKQGMLKNSISLESLLESHERPFVIIDASLSIVGINKAWEQKFSVTKEELIGLPCCHSSPHCRHNQLFQNLEPYSSKKIEDKGQKLTVRGFPLLDSDGTVYLGESIIRSSDLLKSGASSMMVGSSLAFAQYKSKLLKSAKTRASTLLNGETGTGKELAAQFIHTHSKQANHELVIVDCTVLTESLFESELFGHEKGSFTGATGAKKGLFELAKDGTIFLDEVGELPLSQQPKLLRVLETGKFRRVGGTSSLETNARVICATHRNLAEMVKTGEFREDLYYRLSVFPIKIPPLRDRMHDVPNLTEHLINQISLLDGQQYTIDRSALVKLLQHQWPGNIRELKNCLQLACSICTDEIITEEDITYMQQFSESTPETVNTLSETITNSNPLIQMESDVIRTLIEKHQGNRKLIAAEMDISERTLYRKLKRFGLN